MQIQFLFQKKERRASPLDAARISQVIHMRSGGEMEGVEKKKVMTEEKGRSVVHGADENVKLL